MKVQGIHWYDITTLDGRAVCGYVPVPNDQDITYSMSKATCARCRQEIEEYVGDAWTVPLVRGAA